MKKALWGMLLWSALTLSACWYKVQPKENHIARQIEDVTLNKTIDCLEDRGDQDTSAIYREALKCYPFLETYKTLTSARRYEILEKIVKNSPYTEITNPTLSNFIKTLATDISLVNISEVDTALRVTNKNRLNLSTRDDAKMLQLWKDVNSTLPDHIGRISYIKVDYDNPQDKYTNDENYLRLESQYETTFDLHKTLKHLWITPSQAQELYNMYVNSESRFASLEDTPENKAPTSKDISELTWAIQKLIVVIGNESNASNNENIVEEEK